MNKIDDIESKIIGIEIPMTAAKINGFMMSMNNTGKMESAESWLPRYTDKIAATGTEEMVIPNNNPIEHEIAIAAKLIAKDSKRVVITPSVNPPIVI